MFRAVSVGRSKLFGSTRLASTEAKLFKKILIANRGEIACRVIRTARKLGVKTVAVYSDVDRFSDHVKMADEAIHIGPSPSYDSYLRGEKIIDACLRTGAQAVHPGYGFLSENLSFCEMCEKNGIVFIGPPPNAIRAMGSKSESKDIMINAKVPVTPGYHGMDQSNEVLHAEAIKIGYPVMIKAVSGGGGKGMRAVFEDSKFFEALDACRREGLKSFNDEKVLIEKLVRAPRHVELQVFGDKFGNAVHLQERDCSVQRRHQKVLEEAPAPNLSPRVRKAMGDAAVACAKAVGYVGAGTVEFLVDSVSEDFYFCEMNTRLQVEHPVTEMITNTDLVEWQLRVASGQPLPMTQEQIMQRTKGCAIEARVYAENPLSDFLPAAGPLVHLRTSVDKPEGDREPGVRVDSGVRSGNSVSTFYDPMIAKLIAFDEDRPRALRKLERALRDFQVSGLPNNIDFLVKCARHHGFTQEQPTTAFFEYHMKGILESLSPSHLWEKRSMNGKSAVTASTHVMFAIAALTEDQKLIGHFTTSSPWSNSSQDWRTFGAVSRDFTLTDSTGSGTPTKTSADFQVTARGNESFSVSHGKDGPCSGMLISSSVVSRSLGVTRDIVLELDGQRSKGTVTVFVNANSVTVVDVWVEGNTGEKSTHAQFIVPRKSRDVDSSSSGSGTPSAKSPMPGKVVKIVAKDGQKVKIGDTIVIVEAMKMEHVISAPSDGIVSICCAEGATVAEGTILAEVVPPKLD